MFVLAVGLFAACEKNLSNEIIPVEELSVVNNNKGPVAFLSLEEMNQIQIDNDLPILTLEDLGITEAEYLAGQERVNNPNVASVRCEGETTLLYLDLIDDDILTMSDVLEARKGILYGYSGGAYDDFGYASLVWPSYVDNMGYPSGNSDLTTYDLVLARRIILGIYQCI